MNQNSGFNLEPISQDQMLVIVALVLVGILALLTIAGMIWGARLKQRRTAAAEEERRRIDDLEASGVEATGTPDQAHATADVPPTTQAPHTAVPSTGPVADGPAAEPSVADEPIAAAAPLDASPATTADPAPAPAPSGSGEETPVTQLKGLGPKIAARLAELGITTVGQLAWIDDAEAEALDAQLGAFRGRMERDRWREQARLLAQGDRAGFEQAFGRLG